TRHFKESIAFIHECRLRGESCLVHCSESGSKLSMEKALCKTKKKPKVFCRSTKHMQQLSQVLQEGIGMIT
ncbi:hypothetical protein JD844_016767, partial [Phrynosoma platyrhinos]